MSTPDIVRAIRRGYDAEDESMFFATAKAICERNAELEAENAKLRKLVRDWRDLAIGGADSLADWNHEQADLEQRMEELGVVE